MWREIGFSMISGVYGTVARIYDILIQTIETGGMYGKEGIADFAANIYVLAGVYMLFRVVIGMINMILNPDTISNEQTGAGKLLTRVITSILLLLAFYPTGILFGANGLFQEVEEVVLGTNGRDGLINRIIVAQEKTSGEIDIEKETKYDSNLLYEQVSADSNSKECYYYEVDKNTSALNNKTTLGGFIKITYRLGYKSGYTAVLNTTPEKSESEKSESVYYKVSTGKIKNGKYGDYYYQNIKGTLWDADFVFKKDNGIWAWSKDETTIPKECPKMIRYNEKTGYANVLKNGVVQRDDIYGGYDSFTEMLDDLKIEYNKDNVETDNDILSELGIGKGKLIANSLKNGEDAFLFAQSVAASFQDCNTSDCETLQYGTTGMFSNIDANQKIISLDEKEFSFDFIISMITGIGIAIYLVVLCVDVIIRKFKWMLLQVLSPIAIVSYADPKDKIFNKWMTNLITVYVDIFIKLVAIKIVMVLLANIEAFGPTDTNLLIRFFYILAILLFAKIVPSMISDIFGLKLGSSFKDITGMLKAGAGLATGAAIGATVGAGAMIASTGSALKNMSPNSSVKDKLKTAIAAGGMGLGTAVGSAIGGMSAGAKGNVVGGAKNAVGVAKGRMGAYREGFSPTDLIAASTVGRMGMDYASRKDVEMIDDKNKIEQLNKMTGMKAKFEDIGEGSKFVKSLRASNMRGDTKFTEIQIEEFRNAWLEANISGDTTALETMLSNVSDSNGNRFEYQEKLIEKGGVAKLSNAMHEARNYITSNSTIRTTLEKDVTVYDAAGNATINGAVTSINSFKDVDNAVKNAQGNIQNIEKKQREITEQDKYRVAAAAKELNKNNK